MKFSNKSIIKKAEKLALESSIVYDPGHDFSHTIRVKKLALDIAKKEGGDLFIIELASILHDVDDKKFGNNNNNKIKTFLKKYVDQNLEDKIMNIVLNISFKNGDSSKLDKEGKIVQDADRIDALGAIGIARAFLYAGHTKINIQLTIEHFNEKLINLKNLINTKTAKKIAEERHKVIVKYLKQIKKELI
jgi:uncharacterized protein